MISQKAKYAFKALIVLARRGRGASVQTEEIAAAAAVPRKFLEQILLQLKANGLVASRRGRSGGYLLLADPETITVSQVLRIVDGPMAPLPCISRTAYSRCRDCPDETECTVRRLFAETYAATLVRMEKTTLAEALRPPGTGRIARGGSAAEADAISVPLKAPFGEDVSTVRGG